METQVNYKFLDWAVFGVANLFNIIMVVIFLARVKEVAHPQLVGLVWVAFIILLAIAVVLNVTGKRERWEILLPVIFIVFLILEVILDYILKLDFRNTWLLGPYLLMYYASIMGIIGYSFRIGKNMGLLRLLPTFSVRLRLYIRTSTSVTARQFTQA